MLYGYRQFYCVHETDDIYKDIAGDVETRVDALNYKLECNFIDRPLLKGKKK